MLTHPGPIGPFESADRVWSEHFWPLYIVLLFCGRAARRHRPVPPRGEVGLVRRHGRQRDAPQRLKTLKWALSVFFLVLGLATLAAYIKIGYRAPGQPRRALRAGAAADAAAGTAAGLVAVLAGDSAMKVVYTDVLVIGGGLAGLRMAIAAKRRGHDAIILSLVPPKRSHSQGGAGRHAGEPRQRDQGPGRQRGRALRGHGARQRLGRRPGRRAHVRQHRAQGGARARRLGRAVEPRAQGRPRRSSSTARR